MFGINLGNLIVHLSADATALNRSLKSVEKQLESASKKLDAAGRKMSIGLTAPLTAIGYGSVAAFSSFDDAMTKSTAIMSGMTEEIKLQMAEQARAISRNAATSAKELADSYYFLASAGMNAEQSMAALPAMEQFAAAGAFSMAQATDLVTDAQSALGLSSKDAQINLLNLTRVGDVLIKANTLANASTEQFSRALTNKAAAALRLLNKDMEEGVAVLAAFADQGLKGEAAGEALNIVLRDLQRASLEQKDVWAAMGMNVYDVTGKMLPLADIIAQLEKKFSTLSDAQKKTTAMTLGFQDRSFSSLQTLIGTSEKIRNYEAELRKAGGTMKDVAEKQMQSFSSQMAMLKNKITDVGIEIGEKLAPYIKMASKEIENAITYWRGLDSATKDVIIQISLFGAAIGPALLALASLTGALKIATYASRVFFIEWLGFTAASATVVLAIVAISAAIMMLADAFFGADTGFLNFVYSIKIGSMTIGDRLQFTATYFLEAWDWAVNKVILAWESLKLSVMDVLGAIYRSALQNGKWISDAFWKVVDKIAGKFIWLGKKLVGMAGAFHIMDQSEVTEVIGQLNDLDKTLKDMGKSAGDTYQKKIDESLQASENRWKEYYDKINKMEQEHAKLAGDMEDQRGKLQTQRATEAAATPMGKTFQEAWGAITNPISGFMKGAMTQVDQLTAKAESGTKYLIIEGTKRLWDSVIPPTTVYRTWYQVRDSVVGTAKAVAKAQIDLQQALKDSAQLTEDMRTPMEKYQRRLIELKTLYNIGHITAQTYGRAQEAARKELPQVQEAESIRKSMMTPLEKFQEQVNKLKDLKTGGFLDPDTYARAMKAANESYDKEAKKGEKKDTGEFRQIALNRFSLSGLTGFTPAKKQQVEAKGVEAKLAELIKVEKAKTSVRVTE